MGDLPNERKLVVYSKQKRAWGVELQQVGYNRPGHKCLSTFDYAHPLFSLLYTLIYSHLALFANLACTDGPKLWREQESDARNSCATVDKKRLLRCLCCVGFVPPTVQIW